jgi:hypothetical protein
MNWMKKLSKWSSHNKSNMRVEIKVGRDSRGEAGMMGGRVER